MHEPVNSGDSSVARGPNPQPLPSVNHVMGPPPSSSQFRPSYASPQSSQPATPSLPSSTSVCLSPSPNATPSRVITFHAPPQNPAVASMQSVVQQQPSSTPACVPPPPYSRSIVPPPPPPQQQHIQQHTTVHHQVSSHHHHQQQQQQQIHASAAVPSSSSSSLQNDGDRLQPSSSASIAQPQQQQQSLQPTPKEQYRQLKKRFKYLVYENECYQEELRNLQRKLLKLSRDKNFLLDRLILYEKLSDSSDDSDSNSVKTIEEKPKPLKKKSRPSAPRRRPTVSKPKPAGGSNPECGVISEGMRGEQDAGQRYGEPSASQQTQAQTQTHHAQRDALSASISPVECSGQRAGGDAQHAGIAYGNRR